MLHSVQTCAEREALYHHEKKTKTFCFYIANILLVHNVISIPKPCELVVYLNEIETTRNLEVHAITIGLDTSLGL